MRTMRACGRLPYKAEVLKSILRFLFCFCKRKLCLFSVGRDPDFEYVKMYVIRNVYVCLCVRVLVVRLYGG